MVIVLPQEPFRPGRSQPVTGNGVAAPGDVSGRQTEDLGRGLLGAGAFASEAGERLEAELDEARVRDTYARASEVVDRIQFDPEMGFLNKVGGEAVLGTVRQDAEDELRKSLETLSGGLDNEIQRNMFERAAGRLRQDAEVRIARHYAREVRSYGAGQAQAKASAHVRDAIRAGRLERVEGEPDPVSVQKAAAVQEIRRWAELRGASEAETGEAVLTVTTDIHSGVVQDLVSQGRGSEAGDYLKTVDDAEIDPVESRRLQGIVDRASTKDEAARYALRVRNSIFAGHRAKLRDPNRTETLPALPRAESFVFEGIQQVQKDFEAGKISLELRDAATAEIERLGKIQKNGEILAMQDVRERAERHLLENGLDTVEDLPAALFQQVQSFGLRDDLNRFAESSGRYITDPEYFSGLFSAESRIRMAQMTPEEFANEARVKLNDVDYRKALAVYADVHQRGGAEDFKLLSDMRRVEVLAERLNISKEDDPERFYRLVDEVEKRGQAMGVKIGPKELDLILREIVSEEVILLPDKSLLEGLLGNPFDDSFTVPRGTPRLPLSLLTPEERQRAAVATQPEGRVVPLVHVPGPRPGVAAVLQPLSVREVIIGRLLMEGIPVTEKEIVQRWVDAGRPGTVDPNEPDLDRIRELVRRPTGARR